jgi:hypothetical protein
MFTVCEVLRGKNIVTNYPDNMKHYYENMIMVLCNMTMLS